MLSIRMDSLDLATYPARQWPDSIRIDTNPAAWSLDEEEEERQNTIEAFICFVY